MITKFKNIKNLAVFKDFDWDSEVRAKKGNHIIFFKKINILYGRNFTGKTTLSRVVRALETGSISDKYENPECRICIAGNTDVTHSDFSSHNKTIRVFNDDFVKENLRFIVNQDENVQPFAILGEGNNEIEDEIKQLKTSLGSNEENKESGLYKDLKSLTALFKVANKVYTNAKNSLNSQLSSKATGRPNGIKYQSEKFGDQNYNINKLSTEILEVKKNSFIPLTDQEKQQAELVLNEQTKDEISEFDDLKLVFSDLSSKTKEIVNREIGQSNKIQELVKNAVLNRWVKDGKKLHQDRLEICSFCNNKIDESRWIELDKHFDEESDLLEKDIIDLLDKINTEKTRVSEISILKKEQVYSKFHSELENTTKSFKEEINSHNTSLKSLEKQLNIRKKDILNKKQFIVVEDNSNKVESTQLKVNAVRVKSNDYSENLIKEQSKAKNNLRLREIYDFVNDIKYDDLTTNISTLKNKEDTDKSKKEIKQKEIDDIISQISTKQRQLKDESKGADKVNEFLNNYFGHDFLTLKAIEFIDEQTGNKSYRFEIHRDGKKAYHLSEGEKSLIAFCYFVGKLQDVDTKSKKPIIWIDDPISSLDGNHIFFIYSLINTQICSEDDFEQLFISTHNLNFLKYLKRLPKALNKAHSNYLIVERTENVSTISEMPRYIKDYVTEFNHLFKQITECSIIENVTDENYTIFYNFGNNARKFLEIFLFYKYPDSSSDIDKMKRFFGDEDIPAILTERINNEYSHLAGIFERGQQPIEVPEMKKTAKLIIDRIKELDEDQYNALLKSVGLEEPEIVSE